MLLAMVVRVGNYLRKPNSPFSLFMLTIRNG